MSVVTSGSVVGDDINTLEVGTECKVKQKSKFFSGKVAASGEIRLYVYRVLVTMFLIIQDERMLC